MAISTVDDGEKMPESLDPRVYFAAERTLLAWVRTGLAMMGFGFVVARFGLFLREIAALPDMPHHRSGISLLVGITLVVLGVGVNIGAALKHWQTVRQLERGERLRFSPWSLGMLVAFFLGLLGLFLMCYLLFGLGN